MINPIKGPTPPTFQGIINATAILSLIFLIIWGLLFGLSSVLFKRRMSKGKLAVYTFIIALILFAILWVWVSWLNRDVGWEQSMKLSWKEILVIFVLKFKLVVSIHLFTMSSPSPLGEPALIIIQIPAFAGMTQGRLF